MIRAYLGTVQFFTDRSVLVTTLIKFQKFFSAVGLSDLFMGSIL